VVKSAETDVIAMVEASIGNVNHLSNPATCGYSCEAFD